MKTGLALCAIALGSFACTSSDEGDPRDEDVIVDGKSDAFDIAEGSPDALGVLDLVNEADRDMFRTKIGLAENAYTQILKHKAGADGVNGNADDVAFATLTELDEVPFVGLQAFEKLIKYARSHGYVHVTAGDPFDPASCTGPALTLGEIDDRLGDLALYQFKMRERKCTDTNGQKTCEAWHDKANGSLSWATSTAGTLHLGKTDGGDRHLWLFAQRQCAPGSYTSWSGSSCSGLGGELNCTSYRGCDGKPFQVYGSSTPFDEPYINFKGNLTARCARLTATVSHDWLHNNETSETEIAVLVNF
jgi:hypothetical protein